MGFEESGDCLTVAIVSLHAQCEGLDTAQDQPGDVRRDNSAQHFGDLPPRGLDERLRGNDHSTHEIRMSTQILRRAVHDYVYSREEWSLIDRSRDGVVHDSRQAMLACDCNH